MNWYVLKTIGHKTNQVVSNLNKRKNIEAFVPQHEYYHRKSKQYLIKPMFTGYVFVKSELDQLAFNSVLYKMAEEKNGIINQLTNKETSALRKQEITMFDLLLDANHVVRMSQAYLQNGRAVVINGPLKSFEDNIVKVDKHNQYAYLDLAFMERRIRVGLKITSKN